MAKNNCVATTAANSARCTNLYFAISRASSDLACAIVRQRLPVSRSSSCHTCATKRPQTNSTSEFLQFYMLPVQTSSLIKARKDCDGLLAPMQTEILVHIHFRIGTKIPPVICMLIAFIQGVAKA